MLSSSVELKRSLHRETRVSPATDEAALNIANVSVAVAAQDSHANRGAMPATAIDDDRGILVRRPLAHAGNEHQKMPHGSMDHAGANSSEMDHSKMEAGKTTAMGVGVINRVSRLNKMVNLTHEPIPELKWPEMTMDLPVANSVDLGSFRAGQKVKFHLELGPDKKYIITDIK